VLAGLPDPFTATRYHSLAVVDATLPPAIEVTARSDSGVMMGLRVLGTDVEGVQFHPESVLTEGGHHLLANWLTTCGRPEAHTRAPSLAAAVEQRRLTAVG
jgi:para-aminobenzoate synthetase component 2